MIVDCHTHIDCTREDVDRSEHLAATETVDVCMVLAGTNGDSRDVNKTLSAYVSKHPQKMVGFAFVEPTKDKISIKSLTGLREKLGLKGVVLYCASCGFHPAHSRAMRFYESAESLGIPVFFHNTGHLGPQAVLQFAQPFLLDEIAARFPALKIIIGAMGLPFVEQTLSLVAKHKNAYADLTIKPAKIWQVYNMVVAAHEWGVMDKMLFGSGFPSSDAGHCIETLLGFNKLLGDTDLPAVPRGNIRGIIERDTFRLLGIEH